MATPIRNRKGEVIGYQERDGTLRDKDKKKIGYYNKRSGTVVDSQNEEVGFIDKDGTVIDRYRRRVGTIAPDGTVHDWHGIQLYSGSAAPLLMDFERPTSEPVVERLDFEKYTREPHPEPASPEGEKRILFQEGFVSPSVIGCLGIIGAIIIGSGILFLLRNPALFSKTPVTPTVNIFVNGTPRPPSSNGTPAVNGESTPVPTAAQLTGKVNTQILNLRSGPGTTFEIVDRLQMDTEVIMTGRSDDSTWLKVTVPSIGKDGWVSVQYIDTQVDVSSLPVVQVPAQ
ncbi:MAG TPA: SH3 domain-containing protein [Anaerolineae bacterium]|nr:SH3 domain-containing protein [Anaerolineae bacterium]